MTRGPANRRRPWAWLAAICAAGGLHAATAPLLRAAQDAGGPPPTRFLILPFENVDQEPRIYWVAEAAAVLLADAFNDLGAGAFTRAERIRAFERINLPALAPLSHAMVIRLGQLLGAEEVVVGSLGVSGDELTVRARRIQIDTGRLLPEVTERGPVEDLLDVFTRVAQALVPGYAVASDPGRRPVAFQTSFEVFESYVKGLLAQSPAVRIRYLDQALRLQPGYAPTRLALWEAFHQEGSHARALAIARGMTGEVRYVREAEFLAAVSLLELDQLEDAYRAFASLAEAAESAAVLNNLGIVQIRRGSPPETGQATHFLARAAALAPDDPDVHFNLGYAYWLARDTGAALHWLRETVRRNPADADAHFVLGAALEATGAAVEAARERELARQLSARYEEELPDPGAAGGVPPGLERVAYQAEPLRAGGPDSLIADERQRGREDLAAFHLARGRRFYAEERDREAAGELRRALFLSPYLGEAHLWLGRVYLRTGRLDAAIDALKIAIWVEETAAARAALGQAYLQTGDGPAARIEAERALRLDPDESDAAALLERLGAPSGR